jgi:hypothetical protein
LSDLKGLLPYCTPKQKQLVETSIKVGSIAGAAKALDINERTARKSMAGIRKKAAKQGFAPDNDMTRPVPDGFVVSGVSTYYNEDGLPTGQWVKSKLSEEDRLIAMREAIDEMMADYKGVAKPTKMPKSSTDDIVVAIPMGDPHIGMYAWSEESGEDFDINIAREDLLSAANQLVRATPPASTCLIINLGDFFHADNMSNTTSRSGHSLDVDTRWAKVLKLGCMLMVDVVKLALKKHPKVEVINAIGNHDDHSSVMLAAFMDAYFSDEPRVTIQPTTSKFHYFAFGKNLIGVTHGDTVKHADLGSLMATDKAEEWGASEHRYWYCGHIHNSRKMELRGCTVESFRTLAAKDAWHAGKGYRAGRDMNAIVLHKDFGEIARYRCDIRMARYG